MCMHECQTFLWGGDGHPVYDSQGHCSCVCEDESWSNSNVLGRASCVPLKAHQIFGWVGLALSVGLLCQSAYELHRQIDFHEGSLSASTSPVERCRRHLHVISVVDAIVHIMLYALVLGDMLRWSTTVFASAVIAMQLGGGLEATRMWIYTNDPRLLRDSPALLAISRWLETSVGITTSYCVFSILSIISTLLGLANYNETAFRLILSGGILVTLLISAAFLVCGRSLRSAIKTSMQQQQQQQQQMRSPAEGARDPLEAQEDGRTTVPTRLGRGARRSSLAAAKKKVERVMTFIMAMAIPSCIVGVITITTHYGIEAPLIVMAAITYASLLWLMVNIQLHAGRSRTHGRMFSPKSNGGPMSPNDGFSGINDTLFHQRKIAPTEAPR